MTAPHIIDPAGMLGQALSQASPDLMRSLLQHMINALLSADADAVCGAQWGQQDPQRHTQRNGYRHRPLDTRVGTIDVAIPKLRSGTYFPEWLLQRRKRSESALITVVADCYLAGVSTRRMDKLVKTLGITGLSKSQVSRMATDLDEHVDQFRNRPLHDAGPFTFVAADALTMKVREGGRVVSCAVLVATAAKNTRCSCRHDRANGCFCVSHYQRFALRPSSTSNRLRHSAVYRRRISSSAGSRSGTITVTKPPAAPARTPL